MHGGHVCPGDTTTLHVIGTDNAPAAIGPYSQAIDSGEIVFCSGQIGLDPASGKLVSEEVGAQAVRSLANVEEVLKAARLTRKHVAKTTIFLTSMDDFGKVNEVYAAFFGDHRPARSTVAVAALPKGAKVEIEVLALRPQ